MLMRTAADSIYLADLAPVADRFDILMGYDDGRWPDAAAIAAAYPGKTVIRITTDPNDNEGDMLDVENGDASPADAPGWTVRRRAAGHGGPLNYFSEANRQAILDAYQVDGVPLPGFFVAAMPGDGPVLQQPTDVGHQYEDTGPYDVSVVVDYLPGIDPAPVPSAPTTTGPPIGGTDMPAVPFEGTLDSSGHTEIQVTLPPNTSVIVDASCDLLSVYATNPPSWDLALPYLRAVPAVGRPGQPAGTQDVVVVGPPDHFFTGHAICA